MEEAYLKIKNLELWVRVGVLDSERNFGQLYSIDLYLWKDFKACTKNDDINSTIDYSILIKDIRDHSKRYSCFTIEKYSDTLVNLIKEKSDPDRIKLVLTKCNPPILGFEGEVSIIRNFRKI